MRRGQQQQQQQQQQKQHCPLLLATPNSHTSAYRFRSKNRKIGPISRNPHFLAGPSAQRNSTPRHSNTKGDGSASHVLRPPQPVLPSSSLSPDAKYQWKPMPSMYCDVSSSRTISSVHLTTATGSGRCRRCAWNRRCRLSRKGDKRKTKGDRCTPKNNGLQKPSQPQAVCPKNVDDVAKVK